MTNIIEQDLALSAMIITETWALGHDGRTGLEEFREFMDTMQEQKGIWACRLFILDELAVAMEEMWNDMEQDARDEMGCYDFEYCPYWLAFVFPTLRNKWDTNTPTHQ